MTTLFNYAPDDLAAQLTGTVHDTLRYLQSREYLSDEEVAELENILMVVAIPNRKGFGKRILDRLFNKKEPEGNITWVFPIIELDPRYDNRALPTSPNSTKAKTNKPGLTLVT